MIDGGLRQLFRKHLPDFDFQSIEVGFDRGVPDTNFCCEGVEGWIEFKETKGIKVNVSPEQCAWMARRARAGGRTFIAVRQRTGEDDLLWIASGEFGERLREAGLSPNSTLGSFPGGPRAWNWAKIRAIFLRS